MKKRGQIQIAIDALKKQLHKYKEQYENAVEAEVAARKSKDFFLLEIKRLENQIKQLESPPQQIASLEGVVVKETV